MSFERLKEDCRQNRLQRVDARKLKRFWDQQWVAYADLIAFGDRSESNETAVAKNIVTFHRALSAATVRVRGRIRTFRFTDACFAVSDECRDLILFASALQHQCLALNALLMEKRSVKFADLIVPRITIAYGRILKIPDNAPSDQLFAVLPSALLAGSGVVKAYRIERSTAGGLISVDTSDLTGVRDLVPRGSRNSRRSVAVYKYWRENEGYLAHDGVVDLPWLLLHPDQSNADSLLIDSSASVADKIQVFVQVWGKSLQEYISDASPSATIKHYGASRRHVGLLLHKLLKLRRISVTSPEDLAVRFSRETANQAQQRAARGRR